MTTSKQAMPAEVQMALGRLFAMMSRPAQPGDVEMFHKIRALVMDSAEPQPTEYRPNFVLQRLMGAKGDSA
jgi:hypothetical protein